MDYIFDKLKEQTFKLQEYNFTFNLSNNDNVAVIIEPRNLEILQHIVYNIMYCLGKSWNLHIFAYDINFIKSLFPVHCDFKISRLNTNNLTPCQYNKLLKSSTFWNNITEENIIIFQTDSCILKPFYDISSFINYSFIGGIYYYSCSTEELNSSNLIGYTKHTNCENNVHLVNSPYHHYSINGGFSFRKKSKMLECIKHVTIDMIKQYRKKYYMNNKYIIWHQQNNEECGEDFFFQHALEFLNYKLPSFDECNKFCENLCLNDSSLSSFAIHNMKSLYIDKREHIFVENLFKDLEKDITSNIEKNIVN
jgi:hypothetical protein